MLVEGTYVEQQEAQMEGSQETSYEGLLVELREVIWMVLILAETEFLKVMSLLLHLVLD